MSKKLFKRVILGLSIIFITLIVSVVIFFSVAYNKSKLDIDKLTTANTGIKLYASSFTNEETDYSYNLNRKIININQLPSYTINAFVAIEDKRFYKHNGYDIKRIAKSALVNIKDNNKTQGASTITQQLVKNTLLSNEKTYKRKLKEVMLSMKVEKNFTKDEIMNMYLNTIYFGSSAYGIENASQIYFNKSATDLTLNESAILAGLIKSPNNYSPKYNLENCFKRKNLVLTLMYQQGYINKAEYEKALIEKVDCTEISNSYDNSFYQQALIEACNILNISEKELIRNNYTIITHMDYDLQSKLNQILSNENIDADKLSIVVNPKGEVLAYLGISDFNLTDMKRSPASSLKPLAVYLPAIQHNIVDCSTPILDEETMFGDYKPRNTSDKYYGWTTVADSLAKSLNIPTVKLMNCLTIEKSVEFLNSLDIELDSSDNTLSLALGGLTNGISPINLLEGYTALMNYGEKTSLRFVKKILDNNGRILYTDSPVCKKVSDAESAYLITDMLKKTVDSGTATNLQGLNYEVASKTGTNYVNGKTLDLYNIAYTSNRLVLTWLGDADNFGLENLSSSYHATKINKEIFEAIYTNKSTPPDFVVPDGIIEKDVDLLEYNLNHKLVLANENTPEIYKLKAKFKSNHIPLETSSIYENPNIALDIMLSNKGCEINTNVLEIYDYTIQKVADNSNLELLNFSNKNGEFKFLDEKVFPYEKITYKIVATNKYTNETYTSEEKTIYPKKYLLSHAKNIEKIYNINTKKRWYV